MASDGPGKWPYVLGIFLIAFLAFAALLAFRARDIKERTRLWVVQELSRRFESHVDLKSIDVQAWPTIGVIGQGLSIQYRNHPDIEPLIRIEKFTFHTGLQMDFHGQLRMQATMSQTIGGVKSVFVKPFDPLYTKDGAGTVLPISITGPSDHPTMATTVFHKTLKKQMGTVTPTAKSQ